MCRCYAEHMSISAWCDDGRVIKRVCSVVARSPREAQKPSQCARGERSVGSDDMRKVVVVSIIVTYMRVRWMMGNK